MNASTSLGDTPASTTPPTRRTVDAPTRMFHWLFALSFLGAYLTSDGERWRMLHITLGYTMAGLLAFRMLYGLWGPPQARLSLMLRKLTPGPQWLKSAAASASAGTWAKLNWRQGQNLLMALAVVALLVLPLPVTLSGYLNYNDFGGELMEDLHGAAGDIFLGVVLAHLAMITGLSALRRKNQALPMLTGRTEGEGPDLVKHNARWLALVLLLSVLAYWTWEWRQSPDGLLNASSIAAMRQGESDD